MGESDGAIINSSRVGVDGIGLGEGEGGAGAVGVMSLVSPQEEVLRQQAVSVVFSRFKVRMYRNMYADCCFCTVV